MRRRFVTSRTIVILLALSPLTGCVLGHRVPSAERPEGQPNETIPPQPSRCRSAGARCSWSPGYWHWTGAGHVWVSGRWEDGGGPNLVSNSES